MNESNFTFIAKNAIVSYYEKECNQKLDLKNIYTVWLCKVLQNNKGLFSTTLENDTRYFEVTYNGDKDEIYVDGYVKEANYLLANDTMTKTIK